MDGEGCGTVSFGEGRLPTCVWYSTLFADVVVIGTEIIQVTEAPCDDGKSTY